MARAKSLWALLLFMIAAVGAATPALAADQAAGPAPRLVRIEPAHGSTGVPLDLGRILLTFDQPMDQRGFSLLMAAQAATPPYDRARCRWLDERTFAAGVGRLKPSTTYAVIVNGGSYHNFRSRQGVPVPSTRATFTTSGLAAPEEDDDQDEVRTLLSSFLDPGADLAELTRRLKPQPADYIAFFVPELVDAAQGHYARLWSSPDAVVGPKPGQTQVLIASATSEELQAWDARAAASFPAGYRRIAPYLQPGLTIYTFKFVRPGQERGMRFDGLIHVNGRWVIFPKPWRILD